MDSKHIYWVSGCKFPSSYIRVFARQIHYPWEPVSYVVGECDFHRRSLARRRLFQMINGLPTIFEVVTGTAKKQTKEKTPNSSAKSNKLNSKPSSRQSEIQTPKMAPPKEEDSEGGEEEEDDDEHGNTLCGACGDNYANGEFWICCDICERWFHGKCVRITPARAEHIKQYKCPACSKRARA